MTVDVKEKLREEISAYSRGAVEQLSASLNEPAWMQSFRLQAWETFATDVRKMSHGAVPICDA